MPRRPPKSADPTFTFEPVSRDLLQMQASSRLTGGALLTRREATRAALHALAGVSEQLGVFLTDAARMQVAKAMVGQALRAQCPPTAEDAAKAISFWILSAAEAAPR